MVCYRSGRKKKTGKSCPGTSQDIKLENCDKNFVVLSGVNEITPRPRNEILLGGAFVISNDIAFMSRFLPLSCDVEKQPKDSYQTVPCISYSRFYTCVCFAYYRKISSLSIRFQNATKQHCSLSPTMAAILDFMREVFSLFLLSLGLIKL